MKTTKQKGSILRFLLILVIAFFIASYYFDFSLRDMMESPRVRENIEYVKEHVGPFYNTYLKDVIKEKQEQFIDFLKSSLLSLIASGNLHIIEEQQINENKDREEESDKAQENDSSSDSL